MRACFIENSRLMLIEYAPWSRWEFLLSKLICYELCTRRVVLSSCPRMKPDTPIWLQISSWDLNAQKVFLTREWHVSYWIKEGIGVPLEDLLVCPWKISWKMFLPRRRFGFIEDVSVIYAFSFVYLKTPVWEIYVSDYSPQLAWL